MLKVNLWNFIPFVMHFSCDNVEVVNISLLYLVKDRVHIMARTAQINKEKRQSIITLRHEGQSIRKMSITHEDRHRKEDPELPLLQRISSLELPASEIVN